MHWHCQYKYTDSSSPVHSILIMTAAFDGISGTLCWLRGLVSRRRYWHVELATFAGLSTPNLCHTLLNANNDIRRIATVQHEVTVPVYTRSEPLLRG